MYSISTRANSVFFFFVVSLVVLCAFNIGTTFFHKGVPSINQFDIPKFISLYNHPYTKVQHAVGELDADIDFSPCFNWNSNLVFAWITATYKTGPNGVQTKVTIYDNIMLRTEPNTHRVTLDKKSFEYPIVDLYKTLAGKEVLFTLHWEHMPVVGPILKHEIPLGSFTLPDKSTQIPAQYILRKEIDYEDEEGTEY